MSLSKEQQLFDAAFRGELEKVESLCNDPALNINWQHSQGGFTPLYVACEKGQVGVVKYLLSLKGIDPNKPQNEGATPFFIAGEKGHKEVVSLLSATTFFFPQSGFFHLSPKKKEEEERKEEEKKKKRGKVGK